MDCSLCWTSERIDCGRGGSRGGQPGGIRRVGETTGMSDSTGRQSVPTASRMRDELLLGEGGSRKPLTEVGPQLTADLKFKPVPVTPGTRLGGLYHSTQSGRANRWRTAGSS